MYTIQAVKPAGDTYPEIGFTEEALNEMLIHARRHGRVWIVPDALNAKRDAGVERCDYRLHPSHIADGDQPQPVIEKKPKLQFFSTKTYTHAEGLSCCFRQWRADSHCNLAHGYALQVKITFTTDQRDKNGWVQDFGGLKDFKQWLKDSFDHKFCVAADDPHIEAFRALHDAGQINMVVFKKGVGCEAFAETIYDAVHNYIEPRVKVYEVEVREHEGNSAIVRAV
jgi:6-pyruvoyltetrahydropterin/6-carboxytetrahydropterin synthase